MKSTASHASLGDARSSEGPGTDLDSIQQNPARCCDICGGIVFLIVSAGMVGLFLDVGFLKSVLPGKVEMKFNTAFGLLLGGLALRGASCKRGQGWRVVRHVCGVLIACLGALTLTEYLFGWDLGIDNLVVQDSPNAVATSYPGRMAPHTAVSLFLLGLAFQFSSSRIAWHRIFSQSLILCVVFIVLAVLAGHLYGALYFYGVTKFTGMAVNTAVAFLALSAGLYCAQHEDGRRIVFFSDTTGSLTARRLLPAAVLVPLLLGWLSVSGVSAGLYDTAAGIAILVVSTIFVFVLIIGITAHQLHHLELSRREAQEARDQTIKDLQRALDDVRALQGLLPMCAWCKKIRNDSGYWDDVASYIATHSNARISHGICPECAKRQLGLEE